MLICLCSASLQPHIFDREGACIMDTPPLGRLTTDTADYVGRRIGLPEVESPLLRKAIAVWTERRGARRFPPRAAITPRDMAGFLRNVTLYRVAPDGSDFEYRVMGDAAVQAWGRNFAGCDTARLNAVQPGMGDVIRRICASIARRRDPLVLRGTLSKGLEHLAQETVFLPLGPDDDQVDHIISIGDYVAKPASG